MVESRGRNAETAGVAADLIERDQPDIAIERSVLEAFRHDRAAQLLEAHGEAQGLLVLRGTTPVELAGQQLAQEIEDRGVGGRRALLCDGDRPLDEPAILG